MSALSVTSPSAITWVPLLGGSVVVKDLRLKDEDKDKESNFKDKART